MLLDLPDHDSTEVAHHLEVDRLVEVVDLLVFVLDPQKYADAAIHHRYLAPLRTHRDVMLVVLNHVDEIAPERRRDVDRDLARLLDADGLTGVPRLQTSAVTGEGVDALRDVLAERVAATRAAAARLSADVVAVAAAMREADRRRAGGPVEPHGGGRQQRPACRARLGAGRVGRRAHGRARRGALDGAAGIAADRLAGAGLAGPAASRPVAPAAPRPAARPVRPRRGTRAGRTGPDLAAGSEPGRAGPGRDRRTPGRGRGR